MGIGIEGKGGVKRRFWEKKNETKILYLALTCYPCLIIGEELAYLNTKVGILNTTTLVHRAQVISLMKSCDP